MGEDSCLRGHGFESLHRILGGHFSHEFNVKIVCLKRLKINKKRPVIAHFKIPLCHLNSKGRFKIQEIYLGKSTPEVDVKGT